MSPAGYGRSIATLLVSIEIRRCSVLPGRAAENEKEYMQTITRQAALIEVDGEVLVLNLSSKAWAQVIDIAAKEGGGQLVVAPAPNQAVLDLLEKPTCTH